MVIKGEFIEYAVNLDVEKRSTEMQIMIELSQELKLLKLKFNELITRFNKHEKDTKQSK